MLRSIIRYRDADWRKKTWVAPEDAGKAEVPAGYSTLLDGADGLKLLAYTNLKYHPGSGNLSDLYVGCLCDIPFDACRRDVSHLY